MKKDKLLDYVNKVYDSMKVKSVDERNKFSEDLINKTVDETGDVPSLEVLIRLGDLMLYDYVEGDTRSNKMQEEDYPIMSEQQYLRRVRGDNQPLRNRSQAYVEAPLEDASYLESLGEEINLFILDSLD